MYDIPLEYCGTFYAALGGIVLASRLGSQSGIGASRLESTEGRA